MSAEFDIAALRSSDWPQVRAIYLEGIATGNATFEETTPEWDQWDAAHLPKPRLVAKSGDEIVGWAALSAVSSRCVYAGVAEVSVYVAQRARGRGAGTELLSRLISDSEAEGIWTLQAGIFPENTASIALHQSAGFRIVGNRERIGKLDGRWRDVVLMELRSTIAGR